MMLSFLTTSYVSLSFSVIHEYNDSPFICPRLLSESVFVSFYWNERLEGLKSPDIFGYLVCATHLITPTHEKEMGNARFPLHTGLPVHEVHLAKTIVVR